MKNRIAKPSVLVTDFDRTLTYLYSNTDLLVKLAKKMVTFYKEYIYVPPKYTQNNIDGYYVWHALHDLTKNKLEKDISDDINEKAENIVAQFEMEVFKNIGFFDGVIDSLKTLHKSGIRLGLVSSNATKVVRFALEDACILDLFEYVEGRPYPFNPDLIKPNPYPIQKAIERMSPANDGLWYVGDDKVDIIAANAAKVTSIGVCTGKYSGDELSEVGADYIFESFNEIPKQFL